MGSQHYQTNLASEFFIMSVLYRRGLDAHLTMGNKKAIDIVIHTEDHRMISIDVKAVAGKMDWLMGAKMPLAAKNHFIVLLSYEDRFEQEMEPPRVWVVPSIELRPFIQVASNGTTHYISRKQFLAKAQAYQNAWDLLTSPD